MGEQKVADLGSICDGLEGIVSFWWQFWGYCLRFLLGLRSAAIRDSGEAREG